MLTKTTVKNLVYRLAFSAVCRETRDVELDRIASMPMTPEARLWFRQGWSKEVKSLIGDPVKLSGVQLADDLLAGGIQPGEIVGFVPAGYPGGLNFYTEFRPPEGYTRRPPLGLGPARSMRRWTPMVTGADDGLYDVPCWLGEHQLLCRDRLCYAVKRTPFCTYENSDLDWLIYCGKAKLVRSIVLDSVGG